MGKTQKDQPTDLAMQKKVDVRDADPDLLADITNERLRCNMSEAENRDGIRKQLINPYCFKCGTAIVKVRFADSGASLEELLERYIKLCGEDLGDAW